MNERTYSAQADRLYPTPEACLEQEVNDRGRWRFAGHAVLHTTCQVGTGNGAAPDEGGAECWMDEEVPDTRLWVVRAAGGWRMATDDEDIAYRLAAGQPLPAWVLAEPVELGWRPPYS